MFKVNKNDVNDVKSSKLSIITKNYTLIILNKQLEIFTA